MSFPKLFPTKSIAQNCLVYALTIVACMLFNVVLYKVQNRNYDTIADAGCFEIDPIVKEHSYNDCVDKALSSQ